MARGSSDALSIINFLVSLPVLDLLSSPIAVLRRTFMLSGALSLRMRQASSLNMTSKLQCSWFSIDQCLRTADANAETSVRDVI